MTDEKDNLPFGDPLYGRVPPQNPAVGDFIGTITVDGTKYVNGEWFQCSRERALKLSEHRQSASAHGIALRPAFMFYSEGDYLALKEKELLEAERATVRLAELSEESRRRAVADAERQIATGRSHTALRFVR